MNTKTRIPFRPIHVKVLAGVGLSFYFYLGVMNAAQLMLTKPPALYLLEDFGYYARALGEALGGGDPYGIRTIGTAFIYPPPALLLVEFFAGLSPALVRAGAFVAVNCLLLVVMLAGIARRYGYSVRSVWWWFPLAFSFAPFLEMLYLGQINLITQFAVFLMFWFEPVRPLLSGLWLSVGIAFKVSPVLYVGYLLANRESRAVAGVALGVVGLALLSGLRYGFTAVITYGGVFSDLLQGVPLGGNTQSLMALLVRVNWLAGNQVVPAQRLLTMYVLVLFVISGFLALWLREREPLFIIVGLGIMVLPNVMWNHHWVFILLPLFVWLGWRRCKTQVVVWGCVGLMLLQIDRALTYGLLSHLFVHMSIWLLLIGQLRRAFIGPVSSLRVSRS